MNVTGITKFSENIERIQPAAASHPASSENTLQTLSYQAADTTGPAGSTDQASFSSLSSSIADTLAATGPDVRWDRIDSLQQAIASGSYSVSSTDVAASLLSYLVR